MKNLLLPFLLFTLAAQAKDVELKTTLTDVTVFQSGAQIKRSGSVMIPAGEHEIKITDITPLLKKESIQVKGEGDFTILSVNHQVTLEDMKEEKALCERLDTRKKSLMHSMEELSLKIQILNNEETVLTNLKNTSTSTKGVKVEQIGQAQEIVHQKLAAVKLEKLKLSREVTDLFEEYKTVNQHLYALKTPKQNVSYEIVIKVSAKAAVKATFAITYIVPNARWVPAYDLRVQSVAEPLVIAYKANVSQESGEDWNNIHLKISTGDPSQSSQKPIIQPWMLYLNQNYEPVKGRSEFYNTKDKRLTHVGGEIMNDLTGMPIPWCTVMVQGTNVGTMADSNGVFSITLPEGKTNLTLSSVGYNSQTFAPTESRHTFSLTKKEIVFKDHVKTDYAGNLYTVDVPVEDPLLGTDTKMYASADEASVTRGYSASESYGVASKSASTISAMAYNSISAREIQFAKAVKTLNIVNAEFAIDEKYSIPSDPKVISVELQRVQTEAHYQYYCAPRIDKGVFLTAQLTNWEQYNFLEGQANVFLEGTFIGSTTIDTKYLVDTLEISLGRDKGIKVDRKKSKDYRKREALGNDNISYRDWDISVRNGRAKAIDIIIQDQYPVSSDSKITVVPESKTEGKLNEATGIINWQLKLEPSATKSISLKYKVKYPKGTYIGLD